MNYTQPKSIHHDGSRRYVNINENEITPGHEIEIRIRSSVKDNVQKVYLRTCPDGEEHFTHMHSEVDTNGITWWKATIIPIMPIVNYRFLIFDEERAYWYNGLGIVEGIPTDIDDFRILTNYKPVAWIYDRVFYQIFPDRFFDGDPINNVQGGEYNYRGEYPRALKWGEPSISEGRSRSFEFYGGDLVGIKDKLEYLCELGVNGLYLTPIFTSFSNHRYDVVDYYSVDEHLGGDRALIELRKETKDLNVKLMLDIVPNHCGVANPWFVEAQKSLDAQSADFFTFHEHPDAYECWLGVKSLPKLNYKSRALREVMYAGKNSIFRYWLREPFLIDGWRIDVANMLARQGADQLGVEIGQGIRKAVKEVNPEAYILGENFFDGSWQLQGDFLDANMNYAGFMRPLWHWLQGYEIYDRERRESVMAAGRLSTAALVETWLSFMAVIPWSIALQQFNLLDSHDTERIKSVVNGDQNLHRMAIALQFVFPGVPCIYYGDEIGLWGEAGNNRECMDWEESRWDLDLLEYYKKLIALRKTSPALQVGGFQILMVERDAFAFARDAGGEKIIIICNRGEEIDVQKIDLGQAGLPGYSVWVDLFSGQEITAFNGELIVEHFQRGVILLQMKD